MELIEQARLKGFIPDFDTIDFIRMAELQKWLREKHNIFITIKMEANWRPNAIVGYKGFVFSLSSKNQGYNIVTGLVMELTYEKALEEALKESLKLIP